MRNFYPLQYLTGQTTNFTSEALSIKRKILGHTLHVNKCLTPLTFHGHVISISQNRTYLSVGNVKILHCIYYHSNDNRKQCITLFSAWNTASYVRH